MRHTFTTISLLLTALLVLPSCLDEAVMPAGDVDVPVTVEAYQGARVKAALQGSAFPASRSIVLSAQKTDGADAQAWFENIPFSHDGTAWSPATPKRWPRQGSLAFLGYSADGLSVVATHGTDVSAAATLAVPDNGTVQVDILAGGSAARTAAQGRVPLVMKHAQALITFTAAASEAYDATENTGVTFDDVTLLQAKNGGTCTVTRTNNDVAFAWSDLAYVRDVAFPGAAESHLGTTARTVGDGFMLPPQNATDIKVTYTLHGGRDANGDAVDLTLEYVYAASGNWAAGMHYNYDLTIGLNGIVVKAAVEEWRVKGDWFYGTGDTIDEVGDSFSYSEQTVWRWRATAEEPYQPMSYSSGTWGDAVTFVSGGYSITLSRSGSGYEMSHYNIALNTPLTLTSLSAGTFTTTVPGLEYSLDGGAWTAYADPVDIEAESRLQLRCDTPFTDKRISYSGNYTLSGNIMSLVAKTGFAEINDLGADVFRGLFYGQGHLVSASGVTMPNGTLGRRAMCDMFKMCISMTSAPALPAVSIGDSTYAGMFYGVKRMPAAPEIGATSFGTYSCHAMFYSCEAMKTAPQRLAAEDSYIRNYCFYSMFAYCSSLKTVPELPALDVRGTYAYGYMFNSCTSLTDPPVLPGTRLGSACYAYMFTSCTKLQRTPDLNATTLNSSCYLCMFNSCTSLTTAMAVLPAATAAAGCYQSMFSSCTKLETPPVIMFTGSAPSRCCQNMFYSCAKLTTAPVLRASTLLEEAYLQMFYGCKLIDHVVCLATDVSGYNCLSNWLYNTAAEGTFEKDPSATWPETVTRGASGVPVNWTITEYSE